MHVPTLCLILALVNIAGPLTAAQTIPNSISYQGKLTDSAGQIVPDGDYQIQFKLYSTPSGGTPFWTSSQKTIRTSGGVFSTEIEPITPADITNHTDIWLEIVVGDPGIALSPRIKLHSTPFSIRAGELVLPYSGSTSTADAVLSITNSGTGSAAQFSVSDPSNSSPALSVSTSGTGPAARFIGTAEMTGFKLTTTPGAGKVLTSDAEGTGTWKDPITYSAGDGLSLSENIFSIAPLGINESMLANGSVTAEKLADNSITSEKIQDGSILLADIGSNGASAGHVLKFDGTAWTTSPDDNTTYSAGNGLTLEENSFSIAAGGVTSTMLANDSVDSSKIANGTVQFEDFAQGGAAAGQVIKWNGTAWGPAEDEKGG
ncbi:MAG: hypothetical protein QME62_04265, partial [Armatimonadota bacterium]|nr:hypothetical protein [Armatimonadota bacterium]